MQNEINCFVVIFNVGVQQRISYHYGSDHLRGFVCCIFAEVHRVCQKIRDAIDRRKCLFHAVKL